MSNKLPLSLEFFPPKTPEGVVKLAAVRQQLYELKPDFCSVTYGAGGGTQDGTLATVCAIQAEQVEAAPHYSCIGASATGVSAGANHRRGPGPRPARPHLPAGPASRRP